ncbi:MAG: hypothetical protein HY776_04890 [Actinobacteria bacterium]|nr:hypothetical protein [Actinomycetota bacterium]
MHSKILSFPKMKFLTILLVSFLAISLIIAFSAGIEEVRESRSFSRFRNRSRFLDLFPAIRYLSRIKIISAFINSIRVKLLEKRQIDFRLELNSEKHKNSPPLEYFVLSFSFVLFSYLSFLFFKSSFSTDNSLIRFITIFILITFIISLFLPNISMIREELREESGLGNIFRLNSRRMVIQISYLKSIFISLVKLNEVNIFKEKVVGFRKQLASEKRKTSPPHFFGFLFPLSLFLFSMKPSFLTNIFFNHLIINLTFNLMLGCVQNAAFPKNSNRHFLTSRMGVLPVFHSLTAETAVLLRENCLTEEENQGK